MENNKVLYLYGMRLRCYSPGCQPSGVTLREDDASGRYYDIINYTRKLTDEEVREYELDYLGEGRRLTDL